MHTSHNFRFIERDYWFQKALCSNVHLTPSQINHMLDEANVSYCDYTFRFYPDGSVVIIDNDTNTTIPARELSGVVLDFYIRKRIHLIRLNLQEKQLMYA